MITISFAITACNEHEELNRLLQQLYNNINSTDQIIVQLDTTATDKVKSVVSKYDVQSLQFSLNNNFEGEFNISIGTSSSGYLTNPDGNIAIGFEALKGKNLLL